MRELTKKEMRNIDGGILPFVLKFLGWVAYETIDDLEGSASSLANGAKRAPLGKR